MSELSVMEYPVENGYLHHWLVLGPKAVRVQELERFTGPEYKLQIARAYYEEDHGITEPPVEQGQVKLDGFEGRWHAVRCKDDHFVDLTAFYHTTHYLRGWAYAKVVSMEERRVMMTLTTNGPADVWVNGKHCHRQEHFHHQIPLSISFDAYLVAGENEVLVRMEEVAARECPYAMALQIRGFDGVVRLPMGSLNADRRRLLERFIQAATTRRDVFSYTDEITVSFPEDLPDKASLTMRVQTPSGRIYAQSDKTVKAGMEVKLGQAVQFLDGEYRLVVMPSEKEYYEGSMRIMRQIPIRIARGKVSTAPYGELLARRGEALKSASMRSGMHVFAEIASMALGLWSRIDTGMILKTIDSINQRADCSDFYLVGLLGMLYRFGDSPNFPDNLRQPLEDCILNFKYWHDEPGSDAMCYTTENHSILFHTCEVLAGQRYPEHVFTNNGQTGAWHRQKGEQRTLEWLHKRAASGFQEWDSNCYFEEDVLALTHLSDLAETGEVWEMATVVLDKMFFTMAVNSYKGVFGSTHGRTYTPFIKGGQFEATSGITRVAWGMGQFNDHILGSVSLACSNYEVPPLIAAIAADAREEMWDREQHTGTEDDFKASGSRGTGVNKVTYRTPDYMLCSAQDWHPGEPGYQQHIWQATLSPNAVVFVTHPTCESEEGSHRPNYWHGNAILPRVAQWKDVLIAVHNLPHNDWMGFTHAYFPTAAFDEWAMEGGWAFAKAGSGYLAITAARGLHLTTTGDNAFRELRSYGLQNAWLVQMGREALDGSFAEFQQKVLAQPHLWDGLNVEYTSLRGDEIDFGWRGSLMVNGQEQPLSGFPHYENPYCIAELPAKSMEIRYGDEMLRLNFAWKEEEA